MRCGFSEFIPLGLEHADRDFVRVSPAVSHHSDSTVHGTEDFGDWETGIVDNLFDERVVLNVFRTVDDGFHFFVSY